MSFMVSGDAIVGQVDLLNYSYSLVNDVITGTKPFPFQNRKAMQYVQHQDPDLIRVKELLLSGQRPGNKERLPR